MKEYAMDVYQATSDFRIGIGSTTRQSETGWMTIKKGDYYVFDDQANDGTRWIMYNFERGNPYGRDRGKYVGHLKQADVKGYVGYGMEHTKSKNNLDIDDWNYNINCIVC